MQKKNRLSIGTGNFDTNLKYNVNKHFVSIDILNNKMITYKYDEIGNPLSYDGNTYTWERGRQLAGISNSTNTITYNYNENGKSTLFI